MKRKHPRIAITTGDPDGIGFEVTAKALLQLHRSSGHFVVFGSKHENLKANLKWHKLLSSLDGHVTLALRDDPPSAWVRSAAEGCLTQDFDALVTGPMSKRPVGHTEILGEVCGISRPLMSFLGRSFNVVLSTGHIPLTDLKKYFRADSIQWAISNALELRKRLKLRPPVGVLALNPHAGENGLIGTEDQMIATVIAGMNRPKEIAGPLVPDAAFATTNLKRYSVYVAQYHDQGLIPFKALHRFSEGAQLTLGIPFVRTSVDHGTAKDIFNKNKADPGSMVAAIQWARKLL